jgi:hypothetical protein
MNADARGVDADGFSGYTALFSTVVSQHNFWVNYGRDNRTRRDLPGCFWTGVPIRPSGRPSGRPEEDAGGPLTIRDARRRVGEQFHNRSS